MVDKSLSTISTPFQGTQIRVVLTYFSINNLNDHDSSLLGHNLFPTFQIIEWWLQVWNFVTLRDSTFYD